jgi:glyoxylase-like metal-dependent hydrolase (beta-lactamase superfamily II)
LLLEGFPVSSPRGFLGWATAVLLEGEGVRIVIDTGGPGDRHVLLRRLEEIGVDGSDVDHLILTHLHFDHCLNLDLFPAARVVVGRRELEWAIAGADVGTPPFIGTLLSMRDVMLVDDDTTLVPGVRLIATPGHTPGSLSVIYEAGGRPTVMCADLVKNGAEFLNGPATAEGRASVARVLALATRFVPGHERPFVVEGSEIVYEGERDLEISAIVDPRKPPSVARWHFD